MTASALTKVRKLGANLLIGLGFIGDGQTPARPRQEVCAAIAIAFGLIGLLSWLIPAPGLLPFKPVPSTAFLLSGFALFALALSRDPGARGARLWNWSGRSTAAAVSAACISNLLLQDPGSSSYGVFCDNPIIALNSVIFGMMSMDDNVGFAMVSLAALLLGVRIWKLYPSEWLSLLAFSFSVMSILGTLFGQSTFCLFVTCEKLSPVALAVYGLLSLGALFGRSDVGFMSVVASPYAGGTLARRILPGALLIPVVFGILRTAGLKLQIYDSAGALTLAVFLMLIAFLILVWSNSVTLNKKDKELTQTMATLEESRKRVATIINESVDAFIAVDRKGVIQEWNARAERIFGWTKSTVEGTKDCTIFCPEAHEQLLKVFESDTTFGDPIELPATRIDGIVITIEVMTFSVSVNSEPLSCAFIRDVTERKHLQQRFNDFYHAVSHELRSPLTSIRCSLGMIEAMPDCSLSGAALKQLKSASLSSDRLISLVNELLDLRRIELGRFSLTSQATCPLTVSQQAIDSVNALSEMRGINVQLIANTTEEVFCDPDRTVQVIVNLLTNALKFSPKESQVDITISEVENGNIQFLVSDQGPGIPEKAKIFEAFEKGDTPGWEIMPGSGLGLAISRRIVEEMGGEIGYRNNKDIGASFWFVLPTAHTMHTAPVIAFEIMNKIQEAVGVDEKSSV